MLSALKDYIKSSLDREGITHFQIKCSGSLVKKRLTEIQCHSAYLEVYASWKSVEESNIGRKTFSRKVSAGVDVEAADMSIKNDLHQGFSLSPQLTFWTGTLIVVYCLVYCRILSSPGLYLLILGAPFLHPICDNQNISKHCHLSLEGQNHPSLRILDIDIHQWNACEHIQDTLMTMKNQKYLEHKGSQYYSYASGRTCFMILQYLLSGPVLITLYY